MKTIFITAMCIAAMVFASGCKKESVCNMYQVTRVDSIELYWTSSVVVTAINECDLEKIELDIESFGKNQDKVEIGYRFKLDK